VVGAIADAVSVVVGVAPGVVVAGAMVDGVAVVGAIVEGVAVVGAAGCCAITGPATTGAVSARVMTSRRSAVEVNWEMRCMFPLSLLVRNKSSILAGQNDGFGAYAIAGRLSSPVTGNISVVVPPIWPRLPRSEITTHRSNSLPDNRARFLLGKQGVRMPPVKAAFP
jgi:hypothetical protein